uniref:Uncharacterized protein n=1 Tax=Arundo donax TaxID=35708 RepID=A0A0A8ZDH2_ARUDO
MKIQKKERGRIFLEYSISGFYWMAGILSMGFRLWA